MFVVFVVVSFPMHLGGIYR